MQTPRIALIGERDLAKRAHEGIEASLQRYRQETGSRCEHQWVPTASISPESVADGLRDATGIWCVPGSPYESTEGALTAIRHARIRGTAFLGTCGGFQHALMEFARNVLRRGAEHQEMTPEAKEPLIAKLSCSLAGAKGRVVATPSGRFSALLGADESLEEFNCNYGLNADLAGIFAGSDLVFVAHDGLEQIRAFQLNRHPFFVGTLFQPERRALAGSLHPVVRAFFEASGPGRLPNAGPP